jgi:hypothetical protein
MKATVTFHFLPAFRRVFGGKFEVDIPPGGNLLDVIAAADYLVLTGLYSNYEPITTTDPLVLASPEFVKFCGDQALFMEDSVKCLLQLLWNHHTKEFYGDVGVEITSGPPDWSQFRETHALFDPLWPNSNVMLTPDAGC